MLKQLTSVLGVALMSGSLAAAQTTPSPNPNRAKPTAGAPTSTQQPVQNAAPSQSTKKGNKKHHKKHHKKSTATKPSTSSNSPSNGAAAKQ